MDSNNIKQIIYNLGADICGIASIDRFNESPEGFNPIDTLPECKSVIVFGKKFLKGTLDCKNTIPYTIVRNLLSTTLDIMSVDFCNIMETEKIIAVPTGTIDPTVYDKKTNRFRNIVSVKHSAVLAGLGYIGKNTLLITPEYGNMVWLTAVLVDIELEADKIINKNCPDNCFLCIEACPVNALKKDNLEMDQLKCFNYAFSVNEGEGFYFKCNKCRTVCPNCLGIKNKEL
jgi:epoxyqueuosine reductase QueG